jgi:hypothetical protein
LKLSELCKLIRVLTVTNPRRGVLWLRACVFREGEADRGKVLFRRLTIAALLFLAAAPCLPAQDTGSNPTGPERGQHARMGDIGSGVGLSGTITAIAGQTITLKTIRGTLETVKTSDGTAFRRDRQAIKFSELKVGDSIFVAGEEKDGVWSARAVRLQPDAAAMRQELGKRIIAGEIKKIDETKLTILRPDGESQVIEVDEGTSFRNERRESITLADIKTGDHVYGRGEVKNGAFVPQFLTVGDLSRMGRPGPHGSPPSSAQVAPQLAPDKDR